MLRVGLCFREPRRAVLLRTSSGACKDSPHDPYQLCAGLSDMTDTPRSDFDGAAYQARFDALAQSGMDVHGEARLVMSFGPSSVLDAGCGTGRVAIELARQGIDVVGVDVNASMITQARRQAPDLTWVEADLAVMDLARHFDVVILAGNVPLFCEPSLRSDLVSSCAAHVAPAGALVAGFALDGRHGYGKYDLSDYDKACAQSGLHFAHRWSSWDRDTYKDGSSYAVSVHKR